MLSCISSWIIISNQSVPVSALKMLLSTKKNYSQSVLWLNLVHVYQFFSIGFVVNTIIHYSSLSMWLMKFIQSITTMKMNNNMLYQGVIELAYSLIVLATTNFVCLLLGLLQKLLKKDLVCMHKNTILTRVHKQKENFTASPFLVCSHKTVAGAQ